MPVSWGAPRSQNERANHVRGEILVGKAAGHHQGYGQGIAQGEGHGGAAGRR
jgi:hypothetical protein